MIGIISGSGTYALPDFLDPRPEAVATPWGDVTLTRGVLAGAEALHVTRHGPGHARLSNHVAFRANVFALASAGVSCVIGCTACGAVDPEIALGSLIVFDDLHFLANRLPSGEICSFFTEPGDPARAHWIFEEPFSAGVRAALLDGARAAGHPVSDGGCYGHVDGPRFNTRAEIRGLAACGVTAVSQTGGPETVLCGELALPYALIGFATDYANGVMPGDPTPVEELTRLLAASSGAFAATLAGAVPALAAAPPAAPGVVYRIGDQ